MKIFLSNSFIAVFLKCVFLSIVSFLIIILLIKYESKSEKENTNSNNKYLTTSEAIFLLPFSRLYIHLFHFQSLFFQDLYQQVIKCDCYLKLM